MAWCLRPEMVDKFRNALTSGELDPFKIADMASKDRRALFAEYVGAENAKEVNALYESKLLLKNQQQGMITWAKRVAGISKQTKQDIISKIERLDTVLDPKEGEQFLQDLASQRLRLDITEKEAKDIYRLSEEIKTTKAKANEDFTFDKESDRLAYGYAKVNMENYINELKLQSRSLSFREQPFAKIMESVGKIPGVAKSLVASLDNSFWGRQGIKTLADFKTSKVWVRNFLKSWSDIKNQVFAKGKWYKSGDDAVADSIRADIYSRPNALNGKYKVGGYQLDVLTEEAYPSSLPEKIPLLGRLFKASEVAYNGGALRMRADLADRLIALAEQNGVNTLNRDEAQGLGHLIGSMTGRGSLTMTPDNARRINVLFFSIKFMKANFDTLTAHTFDKKVTGFAQKEAQKSLLRIVGTMATVLMLANFFDDDAVDEDPRSTNFGKIKIFGYYVDITGGMASLITLASRITPTYRNGEWGLWSKSSTGNWTNLIAGEYGQQDGWDLLINTLVANKLSPTAGLVRDALRGEMFGGKKFNAKDAVKNLTIPLSIQNYNDLKEDPRTSFLLGSMLIEGLGFSTSNWKYEADWSKSTSKELKQFKAKVGEAKFEQANEDYNRAYSNWYTIATESDDFKKLSDEAKGDLITKAKRQIKDQIFYEYKFKYQQESKDSVDENTIEKLLPR